MKINRDITANTTRLGNLHPGDVFDLAGDVWVILDVRVAEREEVQVVGMDGHITRFGESLQVTHFPDATLVLGNPS